MSGEIGLAVDHRHRHSLRRPDARRRCHRVAHQPRRRRRARWRKFCRRTRDSHQRTVRELPDLACLHFVRIVRPTGDQPRRRQIQSRVERVAHPNIERPGVAVGNDRRLPYLAGRADKGIQQGPEADHQRRGHRCHHRQRLTPARLNLHSDAPASQRHRRSTSKELVAGYLGPRRQPEAVTRPPLSAALVRHVSSPSGLSKRLGIGLDI